MKIRKTFSVVFGFVSLLLVVVMLHEIMFPVKPFEFQLPKFQGRILDGGQVHSGTFSVKKEFSEINTWGKEGILSYKPGVSGGSCRSVVLEAWRPDPLTPGVFEHAESSIDTGWSLSSFHNIDSVKVSMDGTATAYPGVDGALVALSILIEILFLLLACLFWPGIV